VLSPLLLSGVEQRYDYAALGIECLQPIGLVAVAEWASQDEVVLVMGVASRLRNDVIDLKDRAGNPLRGLAVATTVV
jgi:hypothetical protein